MVTSCFVLFTKSRIDVWSFSLSWEILFSLLLALFVLQYLITHFSDFQLACLGSFFLHESVFFLSGLPFIWLERAGWLSHYKIQVCSCWCLLLSRCWMIPHFALQDGNLVPYLLLLFYLEWASDISNVNCFNIACFDLKYVFLPLHLVFILIIPFVLRTILSRSL